MAERKGIFGLLKKVAEPFARLGDKFGESAEEEEGVEGAENGVSPLGTPNDRNFLIEVPEEFERDGDLNASDDLIKPILLGGKLY